jgi:hypothetical protein
LYGELGTAEFAAFHQILKQSAQDGYIDYVLRHFVKVILTINLINKNISMLINTLSA